MFLFRKSAEMPTRDTALKGRETPIPTAERHFVNGRPLQGPYPDGMERAVFGLGCFWGAERKFWQLGDGVFVTAVGYAGGATPNVEHGVVTGEVRGLEVCRVVDDPHTGAVRLEVGVGAHDREAFAILHGDVPTVEALAGVVAAVAEHRRPDGAPHPLNRLAPERLLRWRLQEEPSLLGLTDVVPIQPPVPRQSIKDRAPCSAVGRRVDGSPALVVCSSGVDLDLIPYALDARQLPGVEAGEILVVAPERDLVAITAEIAALADQELSLVAISG